MSSTAGARSAALGGADRIQLCAGPELGGLTPSAGLIEAVVDLLPAHVLIRPRGGDACYDKNEIRVMAKDIEHAIDRGAESVVVAALTGDGDVDLPAMVRLLGAAGEVPVTFHQAFDDSRDPLRALDDLLELGVDRLLTTGRVAGAAVGIDLIAEFVSRSGREMCVMAGGVTPQTAAQLVLSTGVREIQLTDGVAGHLGVPSPELVRATVAAVTDLSVR